MTRFQKMFAVLLLILVLLMIMWVTVILNFRTNEALWAWVKEWEFWLIIGHIVAVGIPVLLLYYLWDEKRQYYKWEEALSYLNWAFEEIQQKCKFWEWAMGAPRKFQNYTQRHQHYYKEAMHEVRRIHGILHRLPKDEDDRVDALFQGYEGLRLFKKRYGEHLLSDAKSPPPSRSSAESAVKVEVVPIANKQNDAAGVESPVRAIKWQKVETPTLRGGATAPPLPKDIEDESPTSLHFSAHDVAAATQSARAEPTVLMSGQRPAALLHTDEAPTRIVPPLTPTSSDNEG